jgi:hypothetical protein
VQTYFQHGKETNKPAATAIYYLLTATEKSLFHRLPHDEIFHFYAGSPVTMVQIDPGGEVSTYQMGNDVLNGQTPQVIVPKNTWQGLNVNQGGQYALMGTTMTPGYDGMEVGRRSELLEKYPQAREWILKLTNPE